VAEQAVFSAINPSTFCAPASREPYSPMQSHTARRQTWNNVPYIIRQELANFVVDSLHARYALHPFVATLDPENARAGVQ